MHQKEHKGEKKNLQSIFFVSKLCSNNPAAFHFGNGLWEYCIMKSETDTRSPVHWCVATFFHDDDNEHCCFSYC